MSNVHSNICYTCTSFQFCFTWVQKLVTARYALLEVNVELCSLLDSLGPLYCAIFDLFQITHKIIFVLYVVTTNTTNYTKHYYNISLPYMLYAVIWYILL